MRVTHTLRWASLVALIGIVGLSGCRLLLVVPAGGKVISQSARIQCGATQSCPVEVEDTDFNETFVALPHPGYVFRGWLRHHRHFCAEQSGACVLATSSLEKNDKLVAVLASDEVFYLSPKFERGFTSELGDWRATWLDTNRRLQGKLSLKFRRAGQQKVRIWLTLPTLELSSGSADAVSIVASRRPNGNLVYRGDIELNGALHPVNFSLNQLGQLTLSVSAKSDARWKTLTMDGTLRGGVLFLNYTLDSGTSAGVRQGTITAHKTFKSSSTMAT